jgi:phage terminase small subunit
VPAKGRQPYATYDVHSFDTPNPRIRPPDSLSELEKRVFRALVSACPADQFRRSDVGLLCRWCELSVMAEQAAFEMTTHGRVTSDGKSPSPWLSVYMQATKQLNGLALRLRLGPQSRVNKAPKTLPQEPSYYDLMEDDDDDGDSADGERH